MFLNSDRRYGRNPPVLGLRETIIHLINKLKINSEQVKIATAFLRAIASRDLVLMYESVCVRQKYYKKI